MQAAHCWRLDWSLERAQADPELIKTYTIQNAANAAGGKYEPPPIPIPLSNRATIEGGDSAAATAEHVPKPPTEAAPKSKRPGKASGRQEKTRDAVGKPNVAEHQRVKKPAKGRPAALPRRQANAIVSSQPGASQPAEEAGFMVGMGGASQAPMASPVLPSIGKSVERGGGSEKERNFSPPGERGGGNICSPPWQTSVWPAPQIRIDQNSLR